ncbi:MAG: hypothetical protein HN719_08255 [Alphaproteobacteria bacterium]|nr:hypothetical protein [Alphaproteobacteria bacterium]
MLVFPADAAKEVIVSGVTVFNLPIVFRHVFVTADVFRFFNLSGFHPVVVDAHKVLKEGIQDLNLIRVFLDGLDSLFGFLGPSRQPSEPGDKQNRHNKK